jgi:hypothetical protein
MTRKTNFEDRVQHSYTLEDKIEALEQIPRGADIRPHARTQAEKVFVYAMGN